MTEFETHLACISRADGARGYVIDRCKFDGTHEYVIRWRIPLKGIAKTNFAATVGSALDESIAPGLITAGWVRRSMNSNPATNRPIKVAQRAQLIQRVLVDGWTPAQVAKSCDFEEHQIARWVADYRRRGMASLRADIVPERLYRRAIGRVRVALFRQRSGRVHTFDPSGKPAPRSFHIACFRD